MPPEGGIAGKYRISGCPSASIPLSPQQAGLGRRGRRGGKSIGREPQLEGCGGSVVVVDNVVGGRAMMMTATRGFLVSGALVVGRVARAGARG